MKFIKIFEFKILFLIHILLLMFYHDSPAQENAYLIGPRDVLMITIYAGGDKQQEVDQTVTSRGDINVPFIGTVKAEGLTASELEEQIAVPLAENYFVNPQVNVFIKGYHSLRYYISGAVKTPGLYERNSKATLMKLIAEAGGVEPNRGNVDYILRDSTSQIEGGENVENLITKKEPQKVDLKHLLDQGDMNYDILLQTGDVVYIPPEKALDVAESKIYVEGEVRNPGVYTYQPGLTALNACIMAGGFGKFAAPARAKIIRKENSKQVIIDIDLNGVKEGRIKDIQLKPGDLINVPETWL